MTRFGDWIVSLFGKPNIPPLPDPYHEVPEVTPTPDLNFREEQTDRVRQRLARVQRLTALAKIHNRLE